MERDDPPKWREDPIESFSDWEIQILASNDQDGSDDGNCITYHVHKNFLAHGSRRSEYFSRLFRSEERFQENQTNTSRIELDPLSAKAFPVLLDYLYDFNLDITATTATALYHLGEYFEVTQLRLEALEFCEEKMTLKNLHYFYVHAERLHKEVILGLVTDYLKAHIHAVRRKHPIVRCSNPQLWINAMGLDEGQQKIRIRDTSQLSQVIVKVCMSQIEETLDATTFRTLTCVLSSIDPGVALDFCELIDRFRPHEEEIEENYLYLLQERCIDALVKNWKNLNDKNITADQIAKITQRSPYFLSSLLFGTVKRARKEVKELSSEVEELSSVVEELLWEVEERSLDVGKLSIELDDCKKMLAAAQSHETFGLGSRLNLKRKRPMSRENL